MLSLTITPNTRKNIRKNSGFTMIEILITIIVVSIGLLGLAGLQISGLRANMSSEVRSKASVLANDIAERMHANPLGVDNPTLGANKISNDNGYASVSMAAKNCNKQPAAICSNYTKSTKTTTNGTTTTTTKTMDAAECTPKQMAAFDVWEWACGTPSASNVVPGGLTNILMNGSGSISCSDNNNADADACSPGSPHTITITWDVLNPDDYGATGTTNTLTRSYSLVMVP